MTFNMKSKYQKGESVHGPGHDGAPKPGFYGDGGHVSHPHNVPNVARGMEHQVTNPTLARGTGKPKRSAYEQVPVHNSMVSKNPTTGKFHFGGMETSRRFDADPASPLDGPPQGKRTVRAEIHPSMRSRNADAVASEMPGTAHARAAKIGHEALHATGRAVLNEALISGGTRLPKE